MIGIGMILHFLLIISQQFRENVTAKFFSPMNTYKIYYIFVYAVFMYPTHSQQNLLTSVPHNTNHYILARMSLIICYTIRTLYINNTSFDVIKHSSKLTLPYLRRLDGYPCYILTLYTKFYCVIFLIYVTV